MRLTNAPIMGIQYISLLFINHPVSIKLHQLQVASYFQRKDIIPSKPLEKCTSLMGSVVNNAAGANESYNIDAFPVHIVIDKNGRIINRSTGARENILPYLEQQIEMALQE